MIWTKDKPLLKGEWYWWRPSGGTNADARPVNMEDNNLYCQFNSGEWSHCPIPFPNEREEKTLDFEMPTLKP